MDPENNKSYFRINKIVIFVAVFVIAAAIAGWTFGRGSKSNNSSDNNQAQSEMSQTDASESLGNKISYQLPDGWKQQKCSGSEAAFIAPNGTSVNCAENPASTVKLSVDPSDTNDCNQLQNVSDVKKHTCISLYINGYRSLKASTEYLDSSPYKHAITIESYYVDTGDGVIKAEYNHTTENEYQMGFDQLVNSIKRI